MLDALCEYLLEKPGLYQYEMADFLWDEFQVHVTTSSIRRALAFRGWTKKTIGRVAKGRNADLQDLYLHNKLDFRSYHYVLVVIRVTCIGHMTYASCAYTVNTAAENRRRRQATNINTAYVPLLSDIRAR
jgi:hypothetical protein